MHSMFRFKKGMLLFVIFLFVSLIGYYPVQAKQSVSDCFEKSNSCLETPDRADPNSAVITDTVLSVGDFFKMISAFVVVIILIFVIIRFLNKQNRFFKRGIIENIGGTSLGTNRSVQIIKIGNRLFVVGVGETVQLLKEIDDDEEIINILEEHNAQLDQMLISNNLVDKIKRFIRKEETAGKVSKNQDFQQLLSEQLKDISSNRKTLLHDIEKKGKKSDE